MLYVERDNFTFQLLFLFISFSCLIPLVKTSSTLLNRNDDTGHPCLILGGKAFSLFPLSGVFPMGFFAYSISCVDVVSSRGIRSVYGPPPWFMAGSS